jgi:hypothetical protein
MAAPDAASRGVKPLLRLVPLAIMAAIVLWQLGFVTAPTAPRERWAMRASMGLCRDAPHFFYFYHLLGRFPVGALDTDTLGPTRRDAEAFVAHHGDRLEMDFGGATNTPRFGDYGKLLLFYPDVWLHHDPGHPSTRPFHEILFVAALLAVFASFWREGHGWLGLAIVVLVGSDPFQVLETYGRGNVFSLPITVTLLALGAHLRFLTGRRGIDGVAWAIALASGVALACFREVRTEAAIVGVSVLATYLLVRGAPWHRRVLLALVFLAAAALTSNLWQRYWSGRFEDAKRFVASAGGHVYGGPHDEHHTLWHSIHCGLGDYGGDRGFEWDDREAFHWATTLDPATNPQPLPYHYSGGYYLDETWDGMHHIAPTDLAAYNRLVRGHVLGAIEGHPLWYAGILVQRLLALLREATPASIAIAGGSVALPYVGWLLLPLLVLFAVRRRRLALALVLFTLPLAIPVLVIYSGRGMTHYGIAQLVALACAPAALWPGRRSGSRSDL